MTSTSRLKPAPFNPQVEGARLLAPAWHGTFLAVLGDDPTLARETLRGSRQRRTELRLGCERLRLATPPARTASLHAMTDLLRLNGMLDELARAMIIGLPLTEAARPEVEMLHALGHGHLGHLAQLTHLASPTSDIELIQSSHDVRHVMDRLVHHCSEAVTYRRRRVTRLSVALAAVLLEYTIHATQRPGEAQ